MTQCPIFLDHHSTTPVDPRVADLVYSAMVEDFGNPNSGEHVFGCRAMSRVEVARRQVASLGHCDEESVLFTSSSTEAFWLALSHFANAASNAGKQLQLALSEVEHPAVIRAVRQLGAERRASIRWLPVDKTGRLLEEGLLEVAEWADLLCVQSANNEVGTINDINRIEQIVASSRSILLVDASQSAGYLPIDLNLDRSLAVISSHKMYGPRGAAAIVGSQISRRRASYGGHLGTPNVPAIAGFGLACRIALEEMAAHAVTLRNSRDLLQKSLLSLLPDIVINGDQAHRLDFSLHISIPGVPNDAILARLYGKLAISTGSACSQGVDEPSHVLKAMGMPIELMQNSLRIGVGRFTTTDEIHSASNLIADAVTQIRSSMGCTK